MSAKKGPTVKSDTPVADVSPTPTADNISAFALAGLSAQLCQAGIIASERTFRGGVDQHSLLSRTLDFLETSAEVIKVRQEHREARQKDEAEDAQWKKLTAGLGPDDFVPVGVLLKFAKLERIKLKPDELEAIRISREWGALTETEREHAIFMFLTRDIVKHSGVVPLPNGRRHQRNGMSYVGNEASRQRMCEEGVPRVAAEISVIPVLKEAHQVRRSSLAKTNAKQRRPRVRGADQQFIPDSEARDASGKMKPKRKRPVRRTKDA